MRGPTLYAVIIILSLILLTSYLNWRLLSAWFPTYRRRSVTTAFWLITLAVVTGIGYSWFARPNPLLLADSFFKFGVYIGIIWAIGQLTLVLMLPLIYILHRLSRPRSASLPAADTVGETDDNVVATEPQPVTGPTLSRRAFLRGTLAMAPFAAFGLSTYGVVAGDNIIETHRLSLPFANLPASLDGLKILQISDTHIGPYFGMNKLDRVIAMVEREKPDLAVITGDLVDDVSLLGPTLDRLSALEPKLPHGLYYCLGNHEYFRDIGRVRAAVAASPIKMLNNANALIVAGERPFYLLGVDYPWTDAVRRASDTAGQVQVRRDFLATAAAGVPADAFTVLIAHHPNFLADGFAGRIPLTLAGHTHGGQVNLFGRPLLPISYLYMRGLYQENGVFGYVNVGAGHWLPFRLDCPAEISVFTLRQA